MAVGPEISRAIEYFFPIMLPSIVSIRANVLQYTNHHATDRPFEMSIGIVTGYGFDSPLEFLCVLAEVMPQPSQISPIGIPKDRSKLAGKIGNRAQMFFKVMDDKCAILVLTDM